MSAGGPTRAEIPPDTRPSALVLRGLQRGTLQVFLPMAFAAQVLAWAGFAITGAYGPWSWLKIGFAYALASVRVPFLVTQRDAPDPATPEVLLIALGALTVAVVVLAFRAGRDQAKGLERRPVVAAGAGAVVGLGFAVPSLLIALPTRLAFPTANVALLRPEIWAAIVLPLLVVGGIGAAGGLAATRDHLVATSRGRTLVASVQGGFTALWWGLAAAFVGFLALAAVEMDATRAYGRAMNQFGDAGAIAVVHHALLLPNQSAMLLSVAMGSPVELTAATVEGTSVSLTGIDVGNYDVLLGLAPEQGRVDFPTWYLAFALIPLVATIAGGRRAGEGARSPRERTTTGALAGIVYAAIVTTTVGFASLVIPFLTGLFGGSTRLGPDLGRTFGVALLWGLVGCTMGALVAPTRPR
jgi:hypothetical protein